MTDRSPNGRLGIDVGAIMRETLSSPRRDLVTRPTGRAVRQAIEGRIARSPPQVSVSLIDLSRIRVLDFSCADEVVAKLLLRYLPPERPSNAFFLFRAVEEVHGHAVDEVLTRHGLAAVCTFGDDAFSLLGSLPPEEHAGWSVLERQGRIEPDTSASLLGAEATALLRQLSERRLAYRHAAGGASALSALARTIRTPNNPIHPGAPHEP